MKNVIKAMVVLLMLSFNNVFAQKPAVVTGTEEGWYKIGERSASFEKESESIIVMGKDEFSSLRLRAADAPISIERLQVYFEGGKIQEVDVKQPLKAGEETREIVLEASNKEIDRIVFTYNTVANDKGEKARVELYGYKDSSVAGKKKDDNDLDKVPDDVKEETSDAARDVQEETLETSNGVRDAAEEVEDNLEETAEKVEDKTENAAAEVREETNEATSKAEAEITDEEMEDKVGPGGQKIYIDDNKNYYYIDDAGNKNYISALELRDRS